MIAKICGVKQQIYTCPFVYNIQRTEPVEVIAKICGVKQQEFNGIDYKWDRAKKYLEPRWSHIIARLRSSWKGPDKRPGKERQKYILNELCERYGAVFCGIPTFKRLLFTADECEADKQWLKLEGDKSLLPNPDKKDYLLQTMHGVYFNEAIRSFHGKCRDALGAGNIMERSGGGIQYDDIQYD